MGALENLRKAVAAEMWLTRLAGQGMMGADLNRSGVAPTQDFAPARRLWIE